MNTSFREEYVGFVFTVYFSNLRSDLASVKLMHDAVMTTSGGKRVKFYMFYFSEMTMASWGQKPKTP
ncbi:hypothetical protein AWU65_08650 [Paenibacillus glucanolyticus]|uniref:Uncharacterized protein n=1 Tax=Paenibacillus glucanolyticus TaxID=59843 RepID=A0A163IIP1_9BACL|nr:hypothetical protein AWU65_08650 [Paenibacillus glucanolyticus]